MEFDEFRYFELASNIGQVLRRNDFVASAKVKHSARTCLATRSARFALGFEFPPRAAALHWRGGLLANRVELGPSIRR